MVDVLVAKEDIEKGEVLSEKHVQEVKIMKENLIEGALDSEAWKYLKGKVTNQYIPKNAQVSEKMVLSKDDVMKENQSVYVLKDYWIHARSSSLRKGDKVDIYDYNGERYLGTYTVAYVKDEGEQEVVTTQESSGKDVLQRDFSSGVIGNVEIIAQLHEYEDIRRIVEEEGITLLLVQKGV